MAYPRPTRFESQERLYEQAEFFWTEYERVKQRAEATEKDRDLFLRSLVAAETGDDIAFWRGVQHGAGGGLSEKEIAEVHAAMKRLKEEMKR